MISGFSRDLGLPVYCRLIIHYAGRECLHLISRIRQVSGNILVCERLKQSVLRVQLPNDAPWLRRFYLHS